MSGPVDGLDMLSELPCSRCGTTTLFEQPECLDGHGADCPEWCCIRCGEAVLTNWYDTQPAPARLRTNRAA